MTEGSTVVFNYCGIKIDGVVVKHIGCNSFELDNGQIYDANEIDLISFTMPFLGIDQRALNGIKMFLMQWGLQLTNTEKEDKLIKDTFDNLFRELQQLG